MSTAIRIAHITDTHLGHRSLNKQDPETGRNARTVDFERAFEWAIGDIIRQRPDAVIHAGDVFDHVRPNWHTLRHFIQQWRRIEEAGIPSLIIAGNHDTPRVRTGGSAYSVLDLALPHTTFYAGYKDAHDVTTFQHLNLHVQAVPHGALTNEDAPAFPTVYADKLNLMVIHGMAKGILEPGKHAEPGEEELDRSLLDTGFDYIALGHYHKRMQPPGIANGWYAGSTERSGWGDLETDPGYLMVTLPGIGEAPLVEPVLDADARPMIDLKPTWADNMRGREIADDILRKIDELPDPEATRRRAMVRARMFNAERGDRREAESILRREIGDTVWHLSVPHELPRQALPSETPEADLEFPDLRELFRQFVAGRTGEAFNDRFAGVLLDRGDRALQDAIAAAVSTAPEDEA